MVMPSTFKMIVILLLTSRYSEVQCLSFDDPEGDDNSLEVRKPVNNTVDVSIRDDESPNLAAMEDHGLLGNNSLHENTVEVNKSENNTVRDISSRTNANQGNAVPKGALQLGLVSESQFITGELVCRYLFYPLLVSAVVVNVVNIVVYSNPSMKSPTSVYLIALSVCELIFSLLSTFRPIFKLIYGTEAVRKQVYLIFAMYNSNFVLVISRRLMYCFTVLVSTERFLAITFPLKSRSYRLIKSPVLFILVFSAFIFLCHMPLALRFDIIPMANSTDYTITRSEIFRQKEKLLDGLSTFNKIFFTYLVLLIGLLMNLFVLIALKRHSNNRKKMNTSVDGEKASRRERQTTVTILTSTFLFIVLVLPLATDSMATQFVDEYNLYKREHYLNLLMKDVNNILIMFSLSTDYIFYMLLSKAYRRVFFRQVPFMATLCRRQAYKEDSGRWRTDTEMSSISRAVQRSM